MEVYSMRAGSIRFHTIYSLYSKTMLSKRNDGRRARRSFWVSNDCACAEIHYFPLCEHNIREKDSKNDRMSCRSRWFPLRYSFILQVNFLSRSLLLLLLSLHCFVVDILAVLTVNTPTTDLEWWQGVMKHIIECEWDIEEMAKTQTDDHKIVWFKCCDCEFSFFFLFFFLWFFLLFLVYYVSFMVSVSYCVLYLVSWLCVCIRLPFRLSLPLLVSSILFALPLYRCDVVHLFCFVAFEFCLICWTLQFIHRAIWLFHVSIIPLISISGKLYHVAIETILFTSGISLPVCINSKNHK